MQDRFQFRVWKGKENRMVYDVTYLNPLLLDPNIDPENKHNSIMQCTGMKDDNDKLIYEGDVVKVRHVTPIGSIREEVGVVEWKYYQFWIMYNKGLSSTLYHEDNTYEILGNIYENPDLI